jgi:hypothetical protein
MKKKYLDFKKIYYKLTLLGFVCLLMAFAPKNNENPRKRKTVAYATTTFDPASYLALTISGYNADVVANGLGALNTTTNNDVDGVNYCYLAVGTQVSGTATPTTYGLPTGGLLDVPNSDLFFQMASYNTNNSLRINQVGAAGEASITFAEANSYEKIHLAVTSGSGASDVAITINFSDATTQVISSATIPDWFSSTALPVVISGIGRGNLSNNGLENPSGNPRIYQLDLNIDPANQTKIVTGITVQKISGGVFNLFAATGKLISECAGPTNLATTAVNSFDADVTWNSANSTDTFEVAIVPTGNPIPATGTASATNSFNFGTLTPNTTYDVYVRTVCTTTGFSFWTGPLTFTTLCADVTEFTQNFDTSATGSSSPMPNCWNKIGSGTTYVTTGSVAPMSPSNKLYMNASGTTPTETCAILPGVSNLQANTHRLRFKAYATATDRFLAIGYITDPSDITTFVQMDEVFLPSTAATAQQFIFTPTGIPTSVTRLAIKNSGSPAGATTAYIDDVSWEAIPTTAPTCTSNIVATPNPTCGNFSNSITWDATPGADGYYLTIGTTTGGNDILDNQDTGINTSYSFVGTINTTYYYTVVPFNAFGSATGCTEQSFMTAATGCYCTSVPTSNDGAGITNVQLGSTDFATNDVTYFDHSAIPVSLSQGLNSNVQISFATGYTYNTYIWIDFNDDYNLDASELVYTGESTSSNPTVLNASFIMPVTATLGSHKMRIVTADALTTANPCYSGSYGVTLDFSVTISPAPSCIPPVSLTASSITNASANLGWTESGTSTVWDIEWGTSGFTPTGTPNILGTTTNPHNLGGLTANTTYSFYVRADCGGTNGVSPWAGPFNFTTLCDPYTIPYFEGFESGYTHNTAVAGCLSQSSTTGTAVWTANNTLTSYNRAPRTGAWNAFLQYGNEDWIYIPIDLVGGTSYTVELYARQDGATASNSNMTVSYGTSATSAAMTNTIVPSTGIISGDYQQIIGAFTPVSSGTYYVGIKGYMNGSPWYISLDDISIDVTPACPAPNGLNVTNITSTSADLSWTGTSGDYEYVLDNDANDPTGSGTSTTLDTYNATLLSPSTTYYFHVRSSCGSTWTTISFTTLALPPANDNCDAAVALTVNTDLACGVVTQGTTVAATDSGIEPTFTVTGTPDNDVWFSFVATSTSHRISLLNVTAVIGTSTDMGMALFDGTGTCTSLTLVGSSDPNTYNVSGLTIGTTYYLSVYGWGASASAQATFDVCVGTPPAPPANDDCANAIAIATLPYTNTQDATSATGPVVSTCSTGMNDGVWYTAIGDGGDMTIALTSVTGWDPEIGIYTGSCGSFTCVGSADSGATGGSETYTISPSIVGTTYYINIGHYSGSSDNPEGPFTLSVSSVLSNESFDNASFSAYPNPVRDVLNLSYSTDITSVQVVNLLGQEVISRKIGSTSAQIDMADLTAGAYIVNVTVDNVLKSIKVIKQ